MSVEIVSYIPRGTPNLLDLPEGNPAECQWRFGILLQLLKPTDSLQLLIDSIELTDFRCEPTEDIDELELRNRPSFGPFLEQIGERPILFRDVIDAFTGWNLGTLVIAFDSEMELERTKDNEKDTGIDEVDADDDDALFP